ncbi:SLC13 family permease [Fundicoccus culcitae]|uniref:SLC13 family permease n=1 Tax=Fundicoccus culcitae TaxID=2969821 RepID=A0ABY5P7J7_9LACT|nr:SLC13 family permease [Fundicoccus culcitae]UUX34704.1 SLC13 family permease [Fundicoccus culcitae]
MDDSILALLILLVIIISFSFQKIPMGITAVLGSIAMALFGLMDYEDVFSGFSNDTVLMVIGMLILGNAFTETGLSQVLGKTILKIKFVQNNERLFLAVVLIFVSIFGFFLPNTAVVAIFLPLVASVAQASGGVITKKNTYMAIGITAVVSGNLTLISSTPQMAAQAILTQTEGVRPLEFFDLTKAAVPMVILTIIYFCTIGYDLSLKVFDFEEVDGAVYKSKEVTIDREQIIKMVICGVVFIVTLVSFILNKLPLGIISILAASILISTKCISFNRAMETLDWNTVLVIAGALGFSTGIEKSGAIDLLASGIMYLAGGDSASPYLIFAVLVIASSLLSTTMSNTATALIMTPMAITIASTLGLNPTTLVIGVIFGCNYDFATPIGTPPMTMTLTGGYRFNDYVKVGGTFNILVLIVTIILLPLIYGF